MISKITIDFETYYDKQYSLSKLTYAEYILGDKFEIIGASIQTDDAPPTWFEGAEEVKAELIRLFGLISSQGEDTRPCYLISHNAYFDLFIITQYLHIPLPAHSLLILADTMLYARATHHTTPSGAYSLSALADQYLPDLAPKGKEVLSAIGLTLADFKTPELAEQYQAYKDYCIHDTALCSALFDKFSPHLPFSERQLIDMTLRMFVEPAFQIDTKLLNSYLETLTQNKEQRIKDLLPSYSSVQEALKMLRSRDKFAAFLQEKGIEVPMKYSYKLGKEIPALAKTDKELLILRHSEDTPDYIKELIDLKLDASSSIEQTRTETYLSLARLSKYMPVYLKYWSAHTGRYGGGQKSNMQNLSKRTRDPLLRRSLIAPSDHYIVATDSSQIEARLLAYIAGQTDVVDTFLAGKDVYIQMATKIYKLPYEEIHRLSKTSEATKEGKKMRSIAKECILAMGYSMSADTFRHRMELAGNYEAAQMADKLVAIYRSSNSYISAFWQTCDNVLRQMIAGKKGRFGGANKDVFEFNGNRIKLPNNTYLCYHNLRYTDNGRSIAYDTVKDGKWITKRVFSGAMAENLTQALAFAILKAQALDIYRAGIPIHLNVHDEWVSVVKREELERTCYIHYKAMSRMPKPFYPSIPNNLLACEVSIGKNYADLYSLSL